MGALFGSELLLVKPVFSVQRLRDSQTRAPKCTISPGCSWKKKKKDYSYQFCQIPQTRCLLQRVTSRSFSGKEGLRWSECDSQRAGLQSRWESLGSTHQGAGKCLEKQKKSLQGQEWSQQQGSFPTSAPLLCSLALCPAGDSVWRGHDPFSHHERHGLVHLPEQCGAGGESPPSSLPSLLSFQPLTTRGCGGGRISLRDLSRITFWKWMLMSTRRAPGSIKVWTWPGMCLNLGRGLWHIYQAVFQARWVSLKMRQVRELPDITNLVVQWQDHFKSLCSTIYCYKFSKFTSFLGAGGRLFR